MLPDVVHGSALVACGSTQALATATLDALATAQTIDAFAGGAKTKRCVSRGDGILQRRGFANAVAITPQDRAHTHADVVSSSITSSPALPATTRTGHSPCRTRRMWTTVRVVTDIADRERRAASFIESSE